MDIKQLDAISQLTQVDASEAVKNTGNDDFKFTLVSHIQESELQAKMEGLMKEIELEGQRIARHKDIRDMKRYRAKIKEFMNEVTARSYSFSRDSAGQGILRSRFAPCSGRAFAHRRHSADIVLIAAAHRPDSRRLAASVSVRGRTAL